MLVELRARACRPSGRHATLNARMWTTFSGIGMSSRATERRRQVTQACANVAEADDSVSIGDRMALVRDGCFWTWL